MGFYDARIKYLYNSCPRLVIMSINTIFHKNYPLDEKVVSLDKEQVGDAEESETFMDMLIGIKGRKYHFEFQLLEDNMAIRMYEYSARETIREITQKENRLDAPDMYEIEIIMPAQAVIFLAGANTKDEIIVRMTLPDGQKVTYMLPCISASMSVEELIRKQLFILIPFQQVQLNRRMNEIKKRSDSAKHAIAMELYSYHVDMKNGLENLLRDDILTVREYDKLIDTLSNIEVYLSEKDEYVRKEVSEMGDKDYICWTDRIEAKGRQEGLSQGLSQGRREGQSQGEARFALLMGKLFADGRTEEAQKILQDEQLRKHLYAEYGITSECTTV